MPEEGVGSAPTWLLNQPDMLANTETPLLCEWIARTVVEVQAGKPLRTFRFDV